MRWALVAVIAVLVISISALGGVAQTVPFPTLYDDFHGAQIDPNRWATVGAHGYELSIGQDVSVGRLNMALQAYGNIGSPAFQDFNAGRVNLPMVDANAAAARGIQVTSRIDDVNITGCDATPSGRADATLFATLFRDGPTPPNPNDFTGIVEAGIHLRVFAFQTDQTVVRVVFFADRCTDPNCDTSFDFPGGFGFFQDITVGQDATLGIELDQANNRIILTKDSETQFVNNVSTNQFNFNLGPLQVKMVRVRHKLERCPTRAQGFIAASFENFRIKP